MCGTLANKIGARVLSVAEIISTIILFDIESMIMRLIDKIKSTKRLLSWTLQRRKLCYFNQSDLTLTLLFALF